MTAPTLHVLTPTYRPAGGVVKIFDYVQHARALGYRIRVWSREEIDPAGPLLAMERFSDLTSAEDVDFTTESSGQLGPEDLVFISLPDNFEAARALLRTGQSPERVVHIIQNIRHVNPRWGGGYPTRLLTRPLARISINRIVSETISPWLDPRALHRVINLGHDVNYFASQRTGGWEGPVRVATTTWKSDIGDRVAKALADRDNLEFRAIRETASWDELRDLYHWSDVFLSAPGAEEGLYLPGLEAMAAGSLVITPDVGGNMAYCRPGENVRMVGFEDVHGYTDALLELVDAPAEQIERQRRAGYDVTHEFDLDRERHGFSEFLDELWPRISAFESTSGPESGPLAQSNHQSNHRSQ